MRPLLVTIIAACVASGAQAAECDPGKAPGDMTHEEALKVYQCIADELYAGYNEVDPGWKHADIVGDYRDWVQVSTIPAAPGFHGGRFLVTWVNETGAEAYTQYAEDPQIPVGTLIAKESFQVTEAGELQRGPLFLMEKVETEASPDTMGWYYMAVAPNGNPMGIDPWKDCNECHVGNFGHQGGLGYPVEEARLPN